MNRRPHLLTGLCAVAFAAPAQAQDVQVDPGSPAGVEYQLPVDRAREEAGGVAGGTDGSSDEAPLFGEGVESGQPTTTPKKKPSAKSGTDSDPATAAEVEADLGTAAPESLRARTRAPDDAGSAIVAIGAGGGGVLLLGGLAGLAWRRRTVKP